MKYDNIF